MSFESLHKNLGGYARFVCVFVNRSLITFIFGQILCFLISIPWKEYIAYPIKKMKQMSAVLSWWQLVKMADAFFLFFS